MAEDSETISALRDSVSGVLRAECPMEKVVAFAAKGSGLAAGLRSRALELGWSAVAAPESAGGAGIDISALVAIYDELGSHLAPLPLLGQQLAIEALATCGKHRAWLERLTLGEAWSTVSFAIGNSPMTIARKGAQAFLRGSASFLSDGEPGDFALMFALNESGSMNALLLEAARVSVTTPPLHDRTRSVSFTNAGDLLLEEGDVIATGEDAMDLHERLLGHAALALAADSVGGGDAALSMTIEYLKTRTQFGRPIGSFQALKHRVSTLKLRLESARALLEEATIKWTAGDPAAQAFASMAKARACDAYLAIAEDAIQLHGGIGFTWESPVHLFIKRAKLNQVIFGDDAWHLDRAAHLFLEA